MTGNTFPSSSSADRLAALFDGTETGRLAAPVAGAGVGAPDSSPSPSRCCSWSCWPRTRSAPTAPTTGPPSSTSTTSTRCSPASRPSSRCRRRPSRSRSAAPSRPSTSRSATRSPSARPSPTLDAQSLIDTFHTEEAALAQAKLNLSKALSGQSVGVGGGGAGGTGATGGSGNAVAQLDPQRQHRDRGPHRGHAHRLAARVPPAGRRRARSRPSTPRSPRRRPRSTTRRPCAARPDQPTSPPARPRSPTCRPRRTRSTPRSTSSPTRRPRSTTTSTRRLRRRPPRPRRRPPPARDGSRNRRVRAHESTELGHGQCSADSAARVGGSTAPTAADIASYQAAVDAGDREPRRGLPGSRPGHDHEPDPGHRGRRRPHSWRDRQRRVDHGQCRRAGRGRLRGHDLGGRQQDQQRRGRPSRDASSPTAHTPRCRARSPRSPSHRRRPAAPRRATAWSSGSTTPTRSSATAPPAP